MRYPIEQKAETHARIVRDASRQVRRSGLSGSGVARLMRASGLTHGGFYKHFRSKDDLLLEAIAEAFHGRAAEMKRRVEKAPAGQEWKVIVNWYLSEEHCSEPSSGCPMVALAPELSRMPSSAKKCIAGILLEHRGAFLPFMPGKTLPDREHAFSIIMPAMLGTLQIARLIPDADMRSRLLKNTREFLLHSFE